MDISQMRVELSKLYGPSWALKVSKMSDKQVYAVYMKHINKTSK